MFGKGCLGSNACADSGINQEWRQQQSHPGCCITTPGTLPTFSTCHIVCPLCVCVCVCTCAAIWWLDPVVLSVTSASGWLLQTAWYRKSVHSSTYLLATGGHCTVNSIVKLCQGLCHYDVDGWLNTDSLKAAVIPQQPGVNAGVSTLVCIKLCGSFVRRGPVKAAACKLPWTLEHCRVLQLLRQTLVHCLCCICFSLIMSYCSHTSWVLLVFLNNIFHFG